MLIAVDPLVDCKNKCTTMDKVGSKQRLRCSMCELMPSTHARVQQHTRGSRPKLLN